MHPTVRCAGCHREERWSTTSPGTAVEVVVAGGQRRPGVDPQWARGRTAIAVAGDPAHHVVGVCSACGQLLVGPAAMPAMPVDLATPAGRLRVADGRIEGPDGPLDAEAADAFLEASYGDPRWFPWLGDLVYAPFFVVLVPIVVGWIFAALFVISFLAAISEGAPSPIR